MILTVKKLLEVFYEKELQKTNQQEFTIENYSILVLKQK